MLLNRQRPNSPANSPAKSCANSCESVFVLCSDSSGEAAGQPRAGASGAGVNSVSRPTARWTSLDSDDRRVFNVWALGVAAFYSSLALSLLVAILLGVYTPAGQKDLSASAGTQYRSTELSAQAARSTGK